MLPATAFRLTILLAGQLPLGLLQCAGALAGTISWWFRSRAARVTIENVNACYPALPARDRRRLARRSMVEDGKTMAEAAFALAASRRRCGRAIISMEGVDLVEAALARGQPTLFIVPHLGNWEMLNHAIGRRFAPVHLYRPTRSSRIDDVIRKGRARTGTRLFPVGTTGIRRQLAALAGGECASLMPDQEPDVHTGEFAPFFGIDCLTTTLPRGLHRRRRPLTVVCWCERLGLGDGFRIRLREVPGADDLSPARLNALVEAAVRERPEQYLWRYKRFRTRPAGQAERYLFRDSALQVLPARIALRALLQTTARVPLPILRRLGLIAGRVATVVPNRYAKRARQNLTLCRDGSGVAPEYVLGAVMQQSATTLLETGVVWHGPSVGEWLTNEPGIELAGCLVLTPPHGNREVLMRYLAARWPVADHYYPASATAIDDEIRRQRNRAGIALFPHTTEGEAALANCLGRNHVVTFCPDQQPRLRAGRFVPFFEVPALTDLALARLAHVARGVYLAAAVRNEDGPGFRLTLTPIETDSVTDPESDAGTVLAAINRQLEQLILEQPEQYRWTDKRFNIRPRGEPKVYR